MISIAGRDDISDLKRLWKEAFGEDEWAERFYLSVFCEGEEPKASVFVERKEDIGIVSMLHYIPCHYEKDDRKYNGAYLYALATDAAFRGQGIMGRLIEYTGNFAIEQKMDFLYLIPAEENLYGYYKRFGFETVYAKDVVKAIQLMDEKQEKCEIEKNEYSICKAARKRYEELVCRNWKKSNVTMHFSSSITRYAIEELFAEKDFYGYEVSNGKEPAAYFAKSGGQMRYYGMNEDILGDMEDTKQKRNGSILWLGAGKGAGAWDMPDIAGYIPY